MCGDTHGNVAAIGDLFAVADGLGSIRIVSVDDLWWRPYAADHHLVTDAVAAGHRRAGAVITLVDGNNEDVDSCVRRSGRQLFTLSSERHLVVPALTDEPVLERTL